MIDLKKWSNNELENLKLQIEHELSQRGSWRLDKSGWYDKIEPGTDDLYQNGEIERLVDENSRRNKVQVLS
jgi:hypothetical protein